MKKNVAILRLNPLLIGNAHQKVRISSVNIILFCLGSTLHIVAETSLLPLVAAALYLFSGYLLVMLPKVGGIWERRIYLRVFFVGFIAAGISALYRTFAGYTHIDAAHFFELSNSSDAWLPLDKLTSITEGAIAVRIWAFFFGLMSFIGFPRETYIGVFLNVTLVSISGAIGLKIVRLFYGEDPYRFNRLRLTFSLCGIYWIYAGLLLRDSVVLLTVNFLLFVWVRFLSQPKFGLPLVILTGFNIVGTFILGALRTEFFFVTFAMTAAAITSLIIGINQGFKKKLIIFFFACTAIIIIIISSASFFSDLQKLLQLGNISYTEAALLVSDSQSLGVSLIINQPLLFRLVFGSFYLFVFPIPFWSGFQLESSYHLFKSFHVIFLYFFAPLSALGLVQLTQNKVLQIPALLFMVFVLFGFTMAVAGTSLETRHWGVFLLPLLILSTLPDLRQLSIRRRYSRYLVIYLSAVFTIHLAWIVLKWL